MSINFEFYPRYIATIFYASSRFILFLPIVLKNSDAIDIVICIKNFSLHGHVAMRFSAEVFSSFKRFSGTDRRKKPKYTSIEPVITKDGKNDWIFFRLINLLTSDLLSALCGISVFFLSWSRNDETFCHFGRFLLYILIK